MVNRPYLKEHSIRLYRRLVLCEHAADKACIVPFLTKQPETTGPWFAFCNTFGIYYRITIKNENLPMSLFSLTLIFIILMDPLGNIPVFLALLKNTSPSRQQKIIVRECIIAFGILVIFLFFGQYILRELQLTPPALSIAGGVILFLVALKMIFPPEHLANEHDKPIAEPFIVPLAIPMVAGPSTMAMVLLFSTQHPENLFTCFLGLLSATIVTTIVLVFSAKLQTVLGERGIIALERLMGMILTVVAVQMLLNGVTTYFNIGTA